MWQRWWQGRREAVFISLDLAWKWWYSLRASWPALAHLFGFHHLPDMVIEQIWNSWTQPQPCSLFLWCHNRLGCPMHRFAPQLPPGSDSAPGGAQSMILLPHKHPSSVSSEWFCSMAVCACVRQHMAKFRNQHLNILGEAASLCWVVTQQQASSLGSHLVIWHI